MTTTTSGAAIQRYKIGYHADEWGQRSSTPSGIPDASGSWVRYADHVNALAAGQATAAQQGAYAALSESFLEIPDVQDESGINAYYSREVVLECIDAARASHGQAPAGAWLWVKLMDFCKKRRFAPANFNDLFEIVDAARAARAPADSVQEDAALWHWLAEYLVGTRTDLDDEIVASETVNDLRKLVGAAIKQGEKQ